MKYLDTKLLTPEANLACDEALLDFCEEGYPHEIIRFWEPAKTFVVLGYSNKISDEVNLFCCQKNQIPVFRRVSGGGAVLQGPGCLNYSLILKISRSRKLESITQTNRYVLQKNKTALEKILGKPVQIQGHTDLTLRNQKFSGNAQRRKRNFLLFHGTFLIELDITLMGKLLPLPSKRPAYRQNRSNKDFLTHLQLSRLRIKKALRQAWGAQTRMEEIPEEKIKKLTEEKYSKAEWNFKF